MKYLITLILLSGCDVIPRGKREKTYPKFTVNQKLIVTKGFHRNLPFRPYDVMEGYCYNGIEDRLSFAYKGTVETETRYIHDIVICENDLRSL